MKDNWNILARLLDTPGVSDPPAEEKHEAKPAARSEPAGTSKSGTPTASEPKKTEPTGQTAVDANKAKTNKPGSILEALKAKIPPQILPGFGNSSDDQPNQTEPEEASTTASTSPDPKSRSSDSLGLRSGNSGQTDIETADFEGDNATTQEGLGGWSDLASELGIEESAETQTKAPRESRSSKTESANKMRPDTPPRRKKKSTGFATGLGFGNDEQAEDEQQDPISSEAASEDPLATASAFGERNPKKSSSHRGDQSKSRRDRNEDREAGSPRRRSTRDRKIPDHQGKQRGERSEDKSSQSPEASAETSQEQGERGRRRSQSQDHSASGGESPQRGKRGRRRGTRQRMTEDDLDRLDSAAPTEPTQSDTKDEDSRPRRRRGRRSEKSSDAPRNSDQRRPEQRQREDRERDEPEDDFGSEILSEESKQTMDDEGTRSRSRRRGRRGRGRGRERGEGSERDKEPAPQKETDDDPLLSSSAFGDHHEDEPEAQEPRRGRRGSKSRERSESNGTRESGRGRSSTRSSSEDDNRRSDENEPRSRRGRGGRNRDEANEDESRRKRSNVPTWLETVELLVDANIENHKNTKSGGGRGRGGGRRR